MSADHKKQHSLNQQSLRGQFLLAMPNLQDPNFRNTVSVLCEHDEQGAMGVIINRPISLTLGEMFTQLDLNTPSNPKGKVFYGGPVQTERGFVLHDDPSDWQANLKIAEGLYLTSSSDILEAISVGVGPDNFMIALGYAGWDLGQIEGEIKENAWLNTPLDSAIVFHTDVEKRFDAAMSTMGLNRAILSPAAGHA